MKIVIINGPNLNMLGMREPEVYGNKPLDEIRKDIDVKFGAIVDLDWFQSNIEGEIVGKIQEYYSKNIDALIINPAAYTHTSVAIFDALKALQCLKFEIHFTNTSSREEFRKTKITTSACDYVMEGLGNDSYNFAIDIILKKGRCDDIND